LLTLAFFSAFCLSSLAFSAAFFSNSACFLDAAASLFSASADAFLAESNAFWASESLSCLKETSFSAVDSAIFKALRAVSASASFALVLATTCWNEMQVNAR
jgi:hypothetical protein